MPGHVHSGIQVSVGEHKRLWGGLGYGSTELFPDLLDLVLRPAEHRVVMLDRTFGRTQILNEIAFDFAAGGSAFSKGKYQATGTSANRQNPAGTTANRRRSA